MTRSLAVGLSGLLGLMGVLYNFKDKESGRLTKWGRAAVIGIAASLLVAILSKYLELQLRQDAAQSEATKARLASEQSLKIITNLERIVSNIHEVGGRIKLTIDLDSQLLMPFKTEIQRLLGITTNDRDLRFEEFINLIPTSDWKEIADGLLRIHPLILVFSRDSDVPSCYQNLLKESNFRFSFKHSTKWVGYPQFGEMFEVMLRDSSLEIVAFQSPIMSVNDLDGAQIIIVESIPYAITSSERIPHLYQTESANLNKFPSLAWEVSFVQFNFDGSRLNAYVRELTKHHDSCFGLPYYRGKLEFSHLKPKNVEASFFE